MNPGKIGQIERVKVSELNRQASATLTIATAGQGFTDFTDAIEDFVRQSGITDGLVTVFCRHTSASLTVQENADPDVRVDLLAALDRLAPRRANYVHDAEGPDDMPAHIRTTLTACSISIPLRDGRLALGTWQGVYLIEHRDHGHRREIVLHVMGS